MQCYQIKANIPEKPIHTYYNAYINNVNVVVHYIVNSQTLKIYCTLVYFDTSACAKMALVSDAKQNNTLKKNIQFKKKCNAIYLHIYANKRI